MYSNNFTDIIEVFNNGAPSNCKVNDDIFTNFLSLAFESEGAQLKELITLFQEEFGPIMNTVNKAEIGNEGNISIILWTIPTRC